MAVAQENVALEYLDRESSEFHGGPQFSGGLTAGRGSACFRSDFDRYMIGGDADLFLPRDCFYSAGDWKA